MAQSWVFRSLQELELEVVVVGIILKENNGAVIKRMGNGSWIGKQQIPPYLSFDSKW